MVGVINPVQQVEAFSVKPKKGKRKGMGKRKNPFASLPQIGGKRVEVQAGTGVRKGVNPQL
jgi:hypothetical protein